MARLRTGENAKAARQASRRFASVRPWIHATADWYAMVEQAKAVGREDLADKFKPKDGATWRSIDKCTEKLKQALGFENKPSL